jgi:serine/threonine-protein kinase
MSAVPTTIGRYEIVSELGRGSMGIVHRAHDPLVGRDVAIKTILLPHGLLPQREQEFRERFLREARAAGRLSHPGIVTVYEFTNPPEDGLPFIAMEYVEGPTLHELICNEGSLNPDWAVAMADTLADALDSAHRAGVVHRDLKPANILVRAIDGAAKIADFGVARVNVSDLTDAGTTYGSPAYMAPERIKGQPADRRSDLYSLAVILYETLCGKRPFEADDFATLCYTILQAQPTPIHQHDPSLAPGFEAFFRRALAKDPADRYPDGAAFREALRWVRAEQQMHATGSSTIQVPLPATEAAERGPGLAHAAPVVDAGAALASPIERLSRDLDRRARPTRGRGAKLGVSLAALALIGLLAGWALQGRRSEDAAAGPAPDLPQQAPVEAARGEAPPVAPPAVGKPAAARDAEPAPVAPKKTRIEPTGKTEPGRKAAPPKDAARRGAPSPPPAAAATEPPAPAAAPAAAATSAALPEPVASSGAAAASAAARSAHLDVRVRSLLKAGSLALFVDGKEIWAADLGTDSRIWGRLKKRAAHGSYQEIDTRFELPAGAHTIEARGIDAADRRLEERVDVVLEPGDTRRMVVTAGGAFGRRHTISLD